MNNYLAMKICEAIMPIKDDSVNVTIVSNSGNVYNNIEVDDFNTKGVVMTDIHVMLLTIRLLKSILDLSKY